MHVFTTLICTFLRQIMLQINPITGRRSEKTSNEALAYELCYDPTFRISRFIDPQGFCEEATKAVKNHSRCFWDDLAASLRGPQPSFEKLISNIDLLQSNILRDGPRGDMAIAAEILDSEFIMRRIQTCGSRTLLPIFKVVSALVPILRRSQAAHREVIFDALWTALRARVEAKLGILRRGCDSGSFSSQVFHTIKLNLRWRWCDGGFFYHRSRTHPLNELSMRLSATLLSAWQWRSPVSLV
jgi:hypothetical protein